MDESNDKKAEKRKQKMQGKNLEKFERIVIYNELYIFLTYSCPTFFSSMLLPIIKVKHAIFTFKLFIFIHETPISNYSIDFTKFPFHLLLASNLVFSLLRKDFCSQPPANFFFLRSRVFHKQIAKFDRH